jgi:PadR family transcriptional regulator, regulatory protein PadR
VILKSLMAASTKPIILSILQSGEDYGYNIIQRVKDMSGGTLEWSDGMLYPVLQRLEKERLISSQWVVSPEGRHRKYYKITPAGQTELTTQLAQWRTMIKALNLIWKPILDTEGLHV